MAPDAEKTVGSVDDVAIALVVRGERKEDVDNSQNDVEQNVDDIQSEPGNHVVATAIEGLFRDRRAGKERCHA